MQYLAKHLLLSLMVCSGDSKPGKVGVYVALNSTLTEVAFPTLKPECFIFH